MKPEIASAGLGASSLDDESLLRLYVDQADRGALETLLCRHASLAYSTAMRVLHHQADAEDAVQTAFIKIMQTAAQYRGASARGVEVWITRIVIGSCKNRIRSAVRRRKWEKLASDEHLNMASDSVEQDSGNQNEQIALQALNGLPEHYRMPIVLHHCRGLSLKETAEALGIPEGTVHTQLRRGLEKLKERVDKAGVEVPALALAAMLPSFGLEEAPRSLMERIPGIVAGEVKLVPVATSSSSAAKWMIRAAAVILAGSGIVAIVMNLSPVQEPAPLTVQVAVPVLPEKIYRRWDFNTPGVPGEFKIVSGSLKHIADKGVDGSGCLEGRDAMFQIDMPVTSFPVRVSYVSSMMKPGGRFGYKVSTIWLPARSMAIIFGVSHVESFINLPPNKQTPWMPHTTYLDGSMLSRWNRGKFHELAFCPMQPDGRISINITTEPAMIDNLVIESISTSELPDLRQYVEAYNRIPPAARKGEVRCPELKRGSSPMNTSNVYFMFFTNCNAVGEGELL